jgi:ABC-type bacteriocin/lantibiotic exporter with double-glycine peptidase domain
VLIGLVGFLILVLGWGGVRTSIHESHAKYDVAAWLEEVLRCHRVFKAPGGRQMALDKADALASHYLDARKDHFAVVWRQTLFALGVQVAASSVVIGLGGWLVITRQLTLGQLVASEIIVSLVASSVSKLGKYAETWYDLMSSSEKIGLVTDMSLDRDGGEAIPDSGSGLAIQASREGSPPFQVAGGAKVALAGPAGSGKTRLLEIICGLRDPGAFRVEIDGMDLRNISLESLRGYAAYVGEGTGLVQGTVLENLRMGRGHVPLSAITSALETVGMRGVVQALPLGLDTPVVPEGSPFSQTQEILLALARAVAGQPRILAIDRVLDGLDPSALESVMRGLSGPTAPWTLLVVSNRDEVLVKCDSMVALPSEIPAESFIHGYRSVSGSVSP